MNEHEKITALKNDSDEFLKYDRQEDINNCLNCQREQCCNCLKIKNGV